MIFSLSEKEPWRSDADLIERFRNSHDVRYIGELYQRYAHLISIQCLKYMKTKEDAEDAAMDLFEVLITDLKKHKVIHFRGWLYTVIRNLCLKRLARKGTVRLNENLVKSESGVMESGEERDLKEQKEVRLEELESCIRKLPDGQRVCVELFYMQGMSYKDVALQTGYTMNEVKSYLQNGKRNLRIKMEH